MYLNGIAKKVFLLTLILNLIVTAQSLDSLKIQLTNIKDLQKIRLFRDSIFVEGTASPVPQKLTINGVPALLSPQGKFIANIPVLINEQNDSAGFKLGIIKLKLFYTNKSETLTKTFRFIPPIKTSRSDKFEIDSNFTISPRGITTVNIGEIIKVKFKASPNATGYFTISGLNKKFPLLETHLIDNYYWGEAVFGSGFTTMGDTIKGIYTGACRIFQPLDSSIITAHLSYEGIKDTDFTLPARITVQRSSTPTILLTKKNPNFITARYGPKLGYKLFLPDSVKLIADGRFGNWTRSKLTTGISIYLPASEVDTLPSGTLPPQAQIQLIRTKDNDKFVDVQFGLSERAPVEIHESLNPAKLILYFYNTTSNIDWAYYCPGLKLIKEIKHYQPCDGVLKVELILTSKTIWGYYVKYSGNVFVLKIKKPAEKNPGFLFWDNQLKGRRIVLDPGHNPGTGAVGPGGLEERNINYVIATELKRALEDEGAVVFLTRPEISSELPLRQRRAKVVSFKPDVSISLHNNAVPQGVNPILHHGYSVYYYYPQALPLAKSIYNELGKNLPLKNFGFYWDNLYMCRITEAPAILIEPSFIIMPNQEELLLNPDFRKNIIDSIVTGLKEFFKEYAE